MSLALENLGYKKYGSSLLNKKYESKETKGNYIIISGNNDLSKNAYSDYIKIENNNMNGEKVKIIIGSETAAEGLDFKYIREIHILEPWFHLNKIQQIIGRGIRNCSHIKLPKEDRNVKIFLYASTMSDKPINDNETLDLKIYRNGEIKSVQMGKIEYLLKTNSVDCNLNIEANKYENDIDYSKECNYQKCDYKCSQILKDKLNKTEIDYDTINPLVLQDQVDDVIKIIKYGSYKTKSLFKEKYYYKLDEILRKLPMERIVVFFALHKILTQNIILFDRNNSESNLIFSNGTYILIPLHKKNKLVTYNDLKSKSNKIINSINLSNKRVIDYIYKQRNNKSTKNDSNINSSISTTIKTKKTFKVLSKPVNINSHNALNNANNKSNILSKTLTNIWDTLISDTKLSYFIDKKGAKTQSIVLDKLESMNKSIFKKGRIIDYLKPGAKEILIKALIKKNKKGILSNDESLIFKHCYNILYTKDDVYYRDPSYKGKNLLFGYKIIKDGKLVYYKINGTNFIRTNDDETKSIQKSTLKKVEENNDLRPASIICGYLENKLPFNNVLFKIRDKHLEGKKGTQIKTGSICYNDGMKKQKIVTYIQRINEILSKIESFSKNDNYKDIDKKKIPGKEFLCYELEIYFRYLDIIDKNNRYLYNSEETLEYRLNEK